MQGNMVHQPSMEVLSPRSANIPPKPRTAMKKTSKDVKPKQEEKPSNPDRIDDRWRPPTAITEPGDAPETYKIGKKLGKGGFAVCFEGRTESRGEIVALKVVKAEVQQKKMMEKFRTEMQIHAKMRHPNIVEFQRAFSLQGHTYVVLELCENGSLTDMVKARSCLSLPEVRRFMIQICGGVKYLHKRSVIHRDLKMGNIFLDSKLNLKIGDFGLAAVMADDQDRRTTLCGTPNYIAPEILSKSGTRGHDYKVDTWAIGVICYAMLMGTPPFQSKTQQEIYSKLKTLEYEWKIDSVNYIPQEAKDCVASCLNLTAADRPDMDELVEQQFFKTGTIADSLDYSCLQTKPIWLLNADPRGDRVRSGYGVDHHKICSECGVGKTSDGHLRPSVGAKAKISALVEIEVENRHGTAPVTPLPEGVLYKQFIEVYNENASIASLQPRSRKPLDVSSGAALSTSTNMAPPSQKILPQRLASLARPTQSFAAQQRQQALPTHATYRPSTQRKEPLLQVQEVVEEKPIESQGLLRIRPVRQKETRSARLKETAMTTTSATVDKIDQLSDRLMKETDQLVASGVTRGTLRSAPRTLRSHASNTLRPLSSSSIPSSDSDSGGLHPASGNVRKRPSSQDECESEREMNESNRPQKKDRLRRGEIFKPRLVSDSEAYTTVPQSTRSSVMRNLQTLYTSLGALHVPTESNRSRRSSFTPHPRVDKWVDYATKHGIAYILSEGSLGMILKSSKTDYAASSCIVVRNARRHTIKRARGLEHQFVPQGKFASDIEFFEQVDCDAEMKRLDVPPSTFELDLEKHSSQLNAATALLNNLTGSAAQRMKEVGLLDKFGKYMNKQMGTSDYSSTETNGSRNHHFIHFYQRMGNVGCWRFIDGGLQFNFPDHTKLIIYQRTGETTSDEFFIDMVYLEPSDARELATHGTLTNETLERRGLQTIRLSDIRNSTLRRTDLDIVETNQIEEKLMWIRGVVGCWIKEGGLGWTGDEKLGWSGMQQKRDDNKTKLQWVTVGRPGGDEDSSAR